MPEKIYGIEVARDGAWWVIVVPELEVTTQARTLGDVDAMARDLIAGATDTDPGSFALSAERLPFSEDAIDYDELAAAFEGGWLRPATGTVLRGPAAAEDGRAALRAALEHVTTENTGPPLTAEQEAFYAALSEQIENEYRDD